MQKGRARGEASTGQEQLGRGKLPGQQAGNTPLAAGGPLAGWEGARRRKGRSRGLLPERRQWRRRQAEGEPVQGAARITRRLSPWRDVVAAGGACDEWRLHSDKQLLPLFLSPSSFAGSLYQLF